jgi:hypothetical protein
LTNIVYHFLPPFHRACGLSDEWATSEPTGNGGRYLLDKIMTVRSKETLILFSVNIACLHVLSSKQSTA